MKILFYVSCLLISCLTTQSFAQIGIGTTSPDPSVALDITSTNKGMLVPRVNLTTVMQDLDGNASTTQPNGMLVYNTGISFPVGFYYWDGEWKGLGTKPISLGSITSLQCSSARLMPNSYTSGTAFSGILEVPYLGGSGGAYSGVSYTSNGLTISLAAGLFNLGGGKLIFSVSGTPTVSSPTTTSFAINVGSQTCTVIIGNEASNPNLTSNIYTTDGTLSASRTITQAANNLTFSSTTGNFIYNPTGTGKMGIATTTPLSGLDLKSSLGLPITNVSAATYTVLASDVVIYFNSTNTQAITLPDPATVTGRVYYLVNNQNVDKTISPAYSNLLAALSTTFPANSTIALQSNGTTWRQFSGGNAKSGSSNNGNTLVGEKIMKYTTSDLAHTQWISPFNEIDISDLDIQVPAGKWLEAEYILIGSSTNGAWPPFGMKVRGYTPGTDDIFGTLEFLGNYTVPAVTTGANYYKYDFTNVNYDNDPGTPRSFDITVPSNQIEQAVLKVRYKNNGTATSTFGYSFGSDINSTNTSVTMKIYQGSTVHYTIY